MMIFLTFPSYLTCLGNIVIYISHRLFLPLSQGSLKFPKAAALATHVCRVSGALVPLVSLFDVLPFRGDRDFAVEAWTN